MNVLLTSVGRRGYLVEYFREALHGQGQVICANSGKDAPAMSEGDRNLVVPWSCEAAYAETIFRICREYKVGLVTSLHDLDIYVLSQHAATFRSMGVIPVFPSAEWGRISLDKLECGKVLSSHGFDVPQTYLSHSTLRLALEEERIRFPIVVKARMGFGSLGLQECHSWEEIQCASILGERNVGQLHERWRLETPIGSRLVFQEKVCGPEYCLALVNDLEGKYVTHFVTHVLAKHMGESEVAVTVDPVIVGDIPGRLSSVIGQPGICGVDCIVANGTLTIIDVNVRFTGDYPFQHIAGANVPAAAIAWAQGKSADDSWFRSRVAVRGYKKIVPSPAEKARERIPIQ